MGGGLLLIDPWLTRRSIGYAHLCLLAQSVIVIAVSLMTPNVDYFATLILVLILQAMVIFPLNNSGLTVADIVRPPFGPL